MSMMMLARGTEAQTPAAVLADSAKLERARYFLILSGVGRSSAGSLSASFAKQRHLVPELSASVWDSLDARLQRLLPTLIDSLAPEYAARFSDHELEVLIRFFESPVGKRFIAEQPGLISKAAEIGQRWAAQLVAQLSRELGIP
jgi:hypothetical protein